MNFQFETYYMDRYGEEFDCIAEYDVEPPEYGYPALLTLTRVVKDGEDVIDTLTPEEFHHIDTRAHDHYQEQCAIADEWYDDEDAPRRRLYRMSFNQLLQRQADRSHYEVEQRLTHESLKRDGEL